MAYDYDKLYRAKDDALGSPTPMIVDFFECLTRPNARILDVGCGQGRDTLFIARLGHRVVGVDISPSGVAAVRRKAAQEQLAIEAVVADITSYQPVGSFDVILVDRTLHMLPPAHRLQVLGRLLNYVEEDGRCLIADEPSNIADFMAILDAHAGAWTAHLHKRSYLFARQG